MPYHAIIGSDMMVSGNVMKTVFSLIESPVHPNFSALYQQLGMAEERFSTARKLHKALQKQQPDFLVGEFIYGYGNNYAGANVCNLDVTLRALQRFAPDAKVIVLVHPSEAQHVGKLVDLFPIHAVLQYPITAQVMQDTLQIPL
jgi:protoheme ferro-lyase